MSDYTATGNPINDSWMTSKVIRDELALIATAVNSKSDKFANSSVSTTSMTIADTTQTFTMETGKEFVPGMVIFIADSLAPSTNYMTGTLMTYSSTTGLATAAISSHGGSGTKTSWTIGLSSTNSVTLTNNTFTGHQNFARATVASAATTADIWNALGNQINFTGTATVTGFPAAPQAGASRKLICAAACAFTAGANMLIDGVSSGNTVTCEANDIVIVEAVSTTQFRLTRIRYLGKPITDVAKNSFHCLTGNGHGSTSTCIRLLTTTTYNNGTAFSITHSATLGTIITINETGLYMFVAYDRRGSNIVNFGLSINATGAELTAAVTTLARSRVMGGCFIQGGISDNLERLSVIDKLTAGDTIRLHDNSFANETTNAAIFGVKIYDI